MKRLLLLIVCAGISACGTINPLDNGATTGRTAVPEGLTHSEQLQSRNPESAEAANETLDEPQGLLQTLAADFSWDRHLDRSEVQKRIRHYQARPRQLEILLARSSEFLPLIAEQIKQRDLPTELAFLPLVESGYQTDIYSGAGAAGLWQLMPGTARHLGLQIDWWYDERLDIQASTEKALDYLEYLNKQFKGDWELVIAAYNGGEGHVRSKMRKAKSRNFWDLSLKRETESYVPRLLAVVEMVHNPSKYAVKLPEIAKEAQLENLRLEHQIDLRLAASAAEMDYQAFKTLNPGYKRWVSPPKGEYELLLPQQQVSLLRGKIASLQPDRLTGWDHYRVKPGDTLIDIARRFGTSVRSLIAVNELPNSRIYARQELLIPRVESRELQIPNSFKELYIVQAGDSLWRIASRNNVSIKQLRKLNAINKNTLIQPGQVLVLNEYYNGEETTYRVKRGDSLSEIAHLFDVAIADLKLWNSIDNKDLIHPGQVLKIRRGS